ncbi:MAG: hypothetical protein ACXVDJ_10435 [Tumebacillaceae bacterium]
MNKKAKMWLAVGLISVVAGTGTVYAATSKTTTATNGTEAAHTHKQGKGDWKGQAGHKAGGFFKLDNQALLTLLKLDKDQLQTQLKAGKTLADIAKAQGVTEQQVIDTIVTAQEQHFAQAVKDGKMTLAQSDQMKTNLSDMAKKMVENNRPMQGHPMGGKDMKGNFGHDDQAVLGVLKITQDQLNQARQAGKSLADIAKEQGVAEQTVIDAIVKQQTTRLADAVKAGKLTQAKADEMSKQFQAFAKQMVEGKPGQHPQRGGFGKKPENKQAATTN